MNWELVDTKLVLDTFTQIEERTYRMPDGNLKKMYIKLTKLAVCVLALTDEEKVILVEQFRLGPNKTLKELPGGGVDEGEDPNDAVARELLEETGYVGNVEYVTHCYDDAYSTMHRACYVATGCKQVQEQDLDDSEFVNVALVDLKDFMKILRSGEMTDVEVAYLGLDKLGLLKSL